MFVNVGIICFVASYGVALALEVSRLFFRSGLRSAVMSSFLLAGLVANSGYLFHQQLALQTGQIVSNVSGFFFVIAWGLIVLDVWLTYSYPRTLFGLVLLPLSLLLIGMGTWWGDTTPFPVESMSSPLFFWRRVHGGAFLLASLAVLGGFTFGVTYFLQEYLLKHRTVAASSALQLPSLETLSTAAKRCCGLTLVFLAVGIFSGLLANQMVLVTSQRGVSLFDPMISGSLLMFGFLVIFFFVMVCRRGQWDGRRMAWLTVCCFLFLTAILLFGGVSRNSHWKTPSSQRLLPSLQFRCIMAVFSKNSSCSEGVKWEAVM